MTETLGLTSGALTSLTELLNHDNMYPYTLGCKVQGVVCEVKGEGCRV